MHLHLFLPGAILLCCCAGCGGSGTASTTSQPQPQPQQTADQDLTAAIVAGLTITQSHGNGMQDAVAKAITKDVMPQSYVFVNPTVVIVQRGNAAPLPNGDTMTPVTISVSGKVSFSSYKGNGSLRDRDVRDQRLRVTVLRVNGGGIKLDAIELP